MMSDTKTKSKSLTFDLSASQNDKTNKKVGLIVLAQNVLANSEIIIVIIKAVATTALISLLFILDNNAQWNSPKHFGFLSQKL